MNWSYSITYCGSENKRARRMDYLMEFPSLIPDIQRFVVSGKLVWQWNLCLLCFIRICKCSKATPFQYLPQNLKYQFTWETSGSYNSANFEALWSLNLHRPTVRHHWRACTSVAHLNISTISTHYSVHQFKNIWLQREVTLGIIYHRQAKEYWQLIWRKQYSHFAKLTDELSTLLRIRHQ